MVVTLPIPALLIAAIFWPLAAARTAQGCPAFKLRRTGLPRLQTALLLLCTGLLPFAGAAPSTQAGKILQSFVVAVPGEFQFSSPAQVTELRGFPLRAVNSIDDTEAPLREVTWFKLVIQLTPTDSDELAFLSLNASHLREASAYLIDASGVVREASAGCRESTGIRFNLSELILDLPRTTGATAEVFVRIVPITPFPLRPAILRLGEVLHEVTYETSFIWLYFGGALFLILFQCVWWFQLRDPASRDYILLSIGMMVANSARYGFINRVNGDQLDFYAAEWLPHIKVLNTILALRFHLTFYNLTATIPLGARVLQGLQTGLLLMLGVGIFLPPAVFLKFAAVAQTVSVFAGLSIGIIAARRRLPGARIALVGWLGIYASSSTVNLASVGLLPTPPLMHLLPLAGILWEMVMSTLGLSRKFQLINEQRHVAEKQEIERHSLKRLVRLLCHDISNPLSVITFSSGKLVSAGGTATPEPVSSHAHRIVKAAAVISEIINSVRMLERLQLSGGRVEVAPTDLATTIREAESLFQEKLQQKSLRLVKAIPPDLPLVLAEENILRSSVLANILSNAIKFSKVGSTIELSAERNETSITLRVRDHGVGIPPELMDDFNRRGMIRTRTGTLNEPGTGLGLPLIHGCTIAMGGRMRLLSGNDHGPEGAPGTIVEITLPIASGVAALPPTEADLK
jgi:signal transduction histidine kinase